MEDQRVSTALRIVDVKDIQSLNLDKIGVKLGSNGYVEVDDFQNTNVKNVYALGDVTGKWMLTPVAIAAARKCNISEWMLTNLL